MTSDERPLSSGLKALAISVIAVAGLGALFGLFGIATNAVSLSGAGDAAFARSAPGLKGAGTEKFVAQAEKLRDVGKRMAVPIIATEIPYVLCCVLTAVFAALVLAGKGSRTWLARAALVACLARAGVGVVSFQLAAEVAQQVSVLAAEMGNSIEANSRRSPLPAAKDLDTVRHVMGGFGAALGVVALAVSVIWSLAASAFFGLTAWAFSRRPSSGPARP